MKVPISVKVDPNLLAEVDAARMVGPAKTTRTDAIEEGLRLVLKAWKRKPKG